MENKIITKLATIQKKLKAPKNQFNKFGNYKYRSCEDILESLKGLLEKTETSLKISDELVLLGDRFYVKATATLYDLESTEKIENTAYAREEETKKGMDGSQITGTASSYARKYALNGLFLIDDTKDADTNEYHKQTNKVKENNIELDHRQELIKYCKENNININETARDYKINAKSTNEDFKNVLEMLNERR
nr:MAG TPA: ERF superfamily protein [Caudoviricetes sp.]